MKEQAQELIDFGNSKEKAEGYGMMRVINKVNELITLVDDDVTDGEILDMIYEMLNPTEQTDVW